MALHSKKTFCDWATRVNSAFLPVHHLAPVHVLVATPGRILDLGGKGIADLRQCSILVMDEADKLLSPEFQPVIEQLISLLASDRQILLFSATFPVTVKAFKVCCFCPVDFLKVSFPIDYIICS